MLPPTDIPAEMYLLLGRLEGKMDSLVVAVGDVGKRTSRVEERVEAIEKWRLEVTTAGKTLSGAARIIWAFVGLAVTSLLAWLVMTYVHSLQAAPIERRETKIEVTRQAPAIETTGSGH